MVLASAAIFSQNGDPLKVVKVGTGELPPIGDNQILLKNLVSALNPSDVSAIEGIYPSQPIQTTTFSKEPAGVVGKEAIYEVAEVGKSVTNVKPGDWARPLGKTLGGWTTHLIVDSQNILPFPHVPGMPPSVAATLFVNPVTAYQLLTQFTKLEKGDWVIQNGANSAVGRAVIQLSKIWGYKVISVIRERSDSDNLKADLLELGSVAVVTDKEVQSPEFVKDTLPKLTGSQESVIRLGLDCVGGDNGTALLNLIALRGSFVIYGCMSKAAVQLGPAPMIFKNVSIHGYWLTANAAENPAAVGADFKEIMSLYVSGKFKTAPVEENVFKVDGTEEEKLATVLGALKKQLNGYSNKKQVIVYK